MLIDLTHPVRPGMPVYPGDPAVAFSGFMNHGVDVCRVSAFSMGTHAGTHLDAPQHMLPDGETVDTARILAACVGEALVIRPDIPRGGSIAPEHIAVPAGTERLIVDTGWGARFGEDDYYSGFPPFAPESLDYLAGAGIVLLGLDTPSLGGDDDEDLHRILLAAGIVIVENLANLSFVEEGPVFFAAAPLMLEGLEGSPVRAWCMPLGDIHRGTL